MREPTPREHVSQERAPQERAPQEHVPRIDPGQPQRRVARYVAAAAALLLLGVGAWWQLGPTADAPSPGDPRRPPSVAGLQGTRRRAHRRCTRLRRGGRSRLGTGAQPALPKLPPACAIGESPRHRRQGFLETWAAAGTCDAAGQWGSEPRRASEPQWVTERRRATETDAPHRPSQRLPGPPGSTSATKSIDFHFGSGGT